MLVLILLALFTFGAVYLWLFVLSGSMTFICIYLLALILLLLAFCGFIVSYNAECRIAKHIDENAYVEEKVREEN